MLLVARVAVRWGPLVQRSGEYGARPSAEGSGSDACAKPSWRLRRLRFELVLASILTETSTRFSSR